MKKIFQKMMRQQLQADLSYLQGLSEKTMPRSGWINSIRRALGMSGYQLAKRMGCSQANVTAFERREKIGRIEIETLNQAAKAMNCRLAYFFIPNKPLDALIEEQARLIVKKKQRSIDHSMELEQQGLTPKQKQQQEDDLVQELLHGSLSKLWDDSDEV